MSCDIAAQIEAAFAGGGRAQPPSQNEALMACAAGDVEACQAVVGGGRRDRGGGSGLRADVPPRYDDGGGAAFPGDPLAGNHTYLGDTVDIINSYCDDPKIGPQLTAYNFCR